MPRLTDFIDKLVVPWIKESQQERPAEDPLSDTQAQFTNDHQCPYGERFGTELNLALGDGAVPTNPHADTDLLTVNFESDIKGAIAPDPDLIINLRLRVDLDPNNPNPTLTCRLLTDEDTTLFELTDREPALDNPRGFIHQTIAAYKDQQYQEKLDKIKAQLTENELKLNRLF